jgi:hypothetical protein
MGFSFSVYSFLAGRLNSTIETAVGGARASTKAQAEWKIMMSGLSSLLQED